MADGLDAIRLLIALATGRGDAVAARSFAASRWGENSAITRALSALVSTGSFGDNPDFVAIGRGFIEQLRGDSIVARVNSISPMRRTAFETPVLRQVQASTASWTGEGLSIEASGNAFDTMKVPPRKLAGLVVFTAETLRLTGGELERALLADLAGAVAEMESDAFINPLNAGDDEKPASVTHDAPVVHSSGSTPDAIRHDVRELLGLFQGRFSRALWVLNAQDAVALRLLSNDVGGADGLTATGGMWCGIPAIGSDACPRGMIVLLDPGGVLYADERIELDLTSEALVTVTDDSGESVKLLLWQQNLRACKATRLLSWLPAREGCAVYVDGLAFDDATT